MKMDFNQFERIRKWIYRNARPVDFARWQFHFENGTTENVLNALSAYQNEDGGFAHAYEPDFWNPNSTGLQTWFAVELLWEIKVHDSKHPLVQGILRYLKDASSFMEGKWVSELESTNDYPHAAWWHWREQEFSPPTTVAAFAVRHAKKGSPLYEKAIIYVKNAAANFMESTNCFEYDLMEHIRIYQCVVETNLDCLDKNSFSDKLSDLMTKGLSNPNIDWLDPAVLDGIKAYVDNFHGVMQDCHRKTIVENLFNMMNSDGIWGFGYYGWPTNYKGREFKKYPLEEALSTNWWMAYKTIMNTLIIKQLDFLQNYSEFNIKL
jgi:hypothetical protein